MIHSVLLFAALDVSIKDGKSLLENPKFWKEYFIELKMSTDRRLVVVSLPRRTMRSLKKTTTNWMIWNVVRYLFHHRYF